ncbi:MAG: glycosyl hydrolase [Nocardioides sp.]|nr:glycosyl hydrolase [Nocardioides sp.]
MRRRVVRVALVEVLIALIGLLLVVGTLVIDDDPAPGDGSPGASSSPSETSSSTSPSTSPSTTPTTTPSVTLTPTPDCEPDVALVDEEATPEALCLAQRLDEWRRTGVMGVGQQLNVSTSDYLAPLRQLEPQRVALVGFDLEELAKADTFDFEHPPVETLLELAADGVVLTASWHTANPATGQDARDLSWRDLGALLDPETPQAEAFWADYDAKLDLLRRLQTGEDGRFQPAAVLFRPLHEANGDWFWWSRADPAAYRALWAELQGHAADAGVHNIVWGWSANARAHDEIVDPMTLVPERVDLVGLDSYDPVTDGGPPQLDLTGLAELAAAHPRTAITETGPHGSKDGAWDPRVITQSALSAGVRPTYALLWFDDGNGGDGYTGRKQIASLRGGRAWLATCPDGLCPLS